MVNSDHGTSYTYELRPWHFIYVYSTPTMALHIRIQRAQTEPVRLPTRPPGNERHGDPQPMSLDPESRINLKLSMRPGFGVQGNLKLSTPVQADVAPYGISDLRVTRVTRIHNLVVLIYVIVYA